MVTKSLILKVLSAIIATILFTIGFTFIVDKIEVALNPYVIQPVHNVLFLLCGLSFVYTIYLGFCMYLHYLKELERAKILQNINKTVIPETLVNKVLDYGLLTVFLYILQSFVYDYVFM